MEQALSAFNDAAQQPQAQSCALLRNEAHKLAGIASTLGYDQVGRAAAKVDAIDGISPEHPAVAELIIALQQALAPEDPS